MKIRLPHPRDVEKRYNEVEERVIRFFSQRNALVFAAAAALSLLLWLTTRQLGTDTESIFSVLDLLKPASLGIIFVVPIAFLHFLAPNSWKKITLPIAAILVAEFCTSTVRLPRNVPLLLQIVFYLLIPIFMLLSWALFRLVKTAKFNYKILSLLYLLLFIAVNFFVYQGLYAANLHDPFMYIWQRKAGLGCLWAMTAVWRSRRLAVDPQIAFNPVHGFRGVLWPASTAVMNESRRELWWRGSVNLAIFALLSLFSHALPVPRGKYDIAVTEFFSVYYAFTLEEVAYANFIAGTARLFGFRVPDLTRFIFLARDPADRWQRGAVYNYAFINEWIFFPLVRIFKSAIIPAFVAFFIFFLFHFPIDTLLGVFHLVDLAPEMHLLQTNPVYAYSAVSMFFTMYFMVVFSRLYWPLGYKRGESNLRAWLSIGLTHLCYVFASIPGRVVVHYFVGR